VIKGCEYYLYVRDGLTCEDGSTHLGDDEREAREMVIHGYVIFGSLVVRDAWVAQLGAEHTVLQLLTVGVN
jgi:hypothetical protein